MDNDFIKYLSGFLTEKRSRLFDTILQNRTRYTTVVLEDIYQSHNASAVLRSCDCFGIQDVHIIENRNPYELNTEVTMGSDKWLSLYTYNKEKNNTLSTIQSLKKSGYRIVATTPHNDDVLLEDFDITKAKFALFFGTELKGLSDVAMEHADEFLRIPMYGFTESYNISVSASIILHTLVQQLNKSKLSWKLSDEEKENLKLEWMKKSIKSADLIEANYRENLRKN